MPVDLQEGLQEVERLVEGIVGEIGGGGGREPLCHSIMFRLNNSFKKFTWNPPSDIVITGVQKLHGSTGNLILATVDLSSADIVQFAAGAQFAGVIIYADHSSSVDVDQLFGQAAVTVRAGTMITGWFENTAEGGVIIFYHHTNVFQS